MTSRRILFSASSASILCSKGIRLISLFSTPFACASEKICRISFCRYFFWVSIASTSLRSFSNFICNTVLFPSAVALFRIAASYCSCSFTYRDNLWCIVERYFLVTASLPQSLSNGVSLGKPCFSSHAFSLSVVASFSFTVGTKSKCRWGVTSSLWTTALMIFFSPKSLQKKS